MKKPPKYLSIIGSAMLVWVAFLLPSFAKAQVLSAVLYSQETDNTLSQGSAAAEYWQELGTGFSGVASSSMLEYKIHLSGNITNGHLLNFQIQDNTGDNCTFVDANKNYSAGDITGILLLDILSSTSGAGCIMSPQNDYHIIVTWMGSPVNQGFQLYGATTTLQYPQVTWTNTNDPDPFITNIFFRIGGMYQQIGVTNPYVVGVSTTTTAAFCDSSFSTTSTGFLDAFAASISNGGCRVFAFLFVPNGAALNDFQTLIAQGQAKIPFSYFYGLSTVFQGLSASSTQNMQVFSFGLSQIDFASSTGMGAIFPTNLEFLSSTTINKFMPVGMHDTLYNLMILVIWLDVAFVLYHKVIPKKANI